MNPLNDDELNSLLEQAKNTPPEPPPELAARALRAYRATGAGPTNWRALFLRPVSIPWPLGLSVALFLVLVGAVGSRSFQSHSAAAQVTREHIVYRDCSSSQQESSSPVASLTFKEFQPVRELRPRVIRSMQGDQ